MTKTPKQIIRHAATDIIRAVAYARVSSKEQEKEGFSISAQLKLLREYAVCEGIAIVEEYVDVETAKQTGRASFGEMVAFLKASPRVCIILVEKTDRLYRNLKDWVMLDELDIEIHLVKEGAVLSRDSRSSEKFMHGIKVLMAKNYIDNLSEETKKGMLEKAEQGIWPSAAPLGYRNSDGASGKRVIEPDPEVAPHVTKMFEWYAAGGFALRDLAKKARQAGFSYRKSGKPVPTSTVLTRSCATGSTWASLSGTADCTRAAINPWSRETCGNVCRTYSTAAMRASIAA